MEKIISNIKLFFLILFLSLMSCDFVDASFQDIDDPEYENIPFKSENGETLYLDIYMPRDGSSGPYPVVMNIPGAFSGLKENLVMGFLANKGYAYVTIDHTIPDTDKNMPVQIRDAKDAVRWIKAHADEYDFNSDRIGVIGWSAGGFLAQLVATTSGNSYFDGTYPGISGIESTFNTKINALVSLAGISDYLALAQDGLISESDQLDIIGCLHTVCPDTYEFLSPIKYVTVDDAPSMFIHAIDDPIDFSQSENIYNEFLAKNIPTELVTIGEELGAHMFPLNNSADFIANTKTEDFFDKQLMQIIPEYQNSIDYSDLNYDDIDGFTKTRSGFSISSSEIKLPENSNIIKLGNSQKLDLSSIIEIASPSENIRGDSAINAFREVYDKNYSSFNKFTLEKGDNISEDWVAIESGSLSLKLENKTTFYAPLNWDSKFYPPIDYKNFSKQGGFIVKAAVLVGNGNYPIMTNKPARLIIPTKEGFPFQSLNGNSWNRIPKCNNADSEKHGNLVFPNSCYVKEKNKTIIWTYHFSTFANFKPERLKLNRIRFEVSCDSIAVKWNTNNKADSKVFYGTDIFNMSGKKQKSQKRNNRKIVLHNLSPETNYFIRIASENEYDDQRSSRIYKILTKDKCLN